MKLQQLLNIPLRLVDQRKKVVFLPSCVDGGVPVGPEVLEDLSVNVPLFFGADEQGSLYSLVELGVRVRQVL